MDSCDHLKIADLKQAVVIQASFLLTSAEHDEPLPRMPMPMPTKDTNPLEYRDDDDA